MNDEEAHTVETQPVQFPEVNIGENDSLADTELNLGDLEFLGAAEFNISDFENVELLISTCVRFKTWLMMCT